LALLACGAFTRFWSLAARPGWQYDEGVYTEVAGNLLRHGRLAEHVPYGQPWSPFLYQPPFYFQVLAKWFALFGPSIYHARILGVLCSLATLSLLFALLWRLHGPRAALLASIPIVLDGWLLYIQRCSYIENMLLLLVTAGMLVYQVALERDSRWWFAAAGAVLGFSAAFKYTGAYALVAVLLCWLILRRRHKGHLILLAAAAFTIAVYLAVMVNLYDSPGHDWFIQQTLVQVRRVLGIQQSGGTLTSPFKALHLLAAQYKVFLPSFVIGAGSFVIAARRLWACYRARDWAPLQGSALLFSWLAAGVVVFGFSSLRFPQYFALILVPMYAFFWTELWHWDRPLRTVTAAVVAAAVLGLGSFWLRVGAYHDNAFAQAQAYAARSIPPHAAVVADESVGDLIGQPYCREQAATPCLHKASYAITWDTYLQSTFRLGDPAFHQLMRGAVPVRRFTGFNGVLTVWRLGPAAPARPVLGVDLYAPRYYLPAVVLRDGARNLGYIHHSLGAQSAGIIWNLYSPAARSSVVARSPALSLTAPEVAALTRQARALGMSVEYRPLIRVGPRHRWEGHIRPPDQRSWFASLYRAELPYLQTAQRLGVHEFVVGTELRLLSHSRYWPWFLAKVRAVYHGTVSYASWQEDYWAPGAALPPTGAYGVDPYPHISLAPSATVRQLTAEWEAYFSHVPEATLARTAMQEVGITAQANAYAHPENWSVPGRPAPQVQANWFTAACETAAHYHMRGIYFYEVNLTDNPARPLRFPAFFVGNRGSRAIRSCLRILGAQAAG
jgi:4-amino-4-deoxy-L-arabinose transferase-like glycosyltransferase